MVVVQKRAIFLFVFIKKKCSSWEHLKSMNTVAEFNAFLGKVWKGITLYLGFYQGQYAHQDSSGVRLNSNLLKSAWLPSFLPSTRFASRQQLWFIWPRLWGSRMFFLFPGLTWKPWTWGKIPHDGIPTFLPPKRRPFKQTILQIWFLSSKISSSSNSQSER